MFKTGPGKTQATTVVHDGKVYRGEMPNLNMKTDLTDSFEYIATIVQGMSSGSLNDNPVYDDFKSKIIESTISGEVSKLISERGHVPENYAPSLYSGRYSSQVAIARGPVAAAKPVPSNVTKVPDVSPAPNFPASVGKASDLLVSKMIAKKKDREDEAIAIDIGQMRRGSSSSPSMLELMELFDSWDRDHPFAKRTNESAEKRLKRVEAELQKVGLKSDTKAAKAALSKTISERVKKLSERVSESTGHKPKKKTAKKKIAKKTLTKKATKKKVTKKKVAKKRNTK